MFLKMLILSLKSARLLKNWACFDTFIVILYEMYHSKMFALLMDIHFVFANYALEPLLVK